MGRLSWYVGFLLVLSGCGRSDASPPGDVTQSDSSPPAAQGGTRSFVRALEGA